MKRALNRDERDFVDDCRAFAREVIAPAARRWDEANAFPIDVHVEAAKRRIPYAGFAIEDGGRGLSHLALVHGGLEMAPARMPDWPGAV